MARDLYEILGVSRRASQQEIQDAYRQLARKYHPDLNQDDKSAKAKFQEVQSAYEVLNDADKRKKYDQFGESYDQMGGGGGANPFGNVDINDLFGGQGGGFSDIFKHFAGGSGGAGAGRGPSRQPRQGRNFQHEVTVSFVTAVLGGEVPVGIVDELGDSKTINIKVPAGIEPGKKIRLRGQGEQVRGGQAGDLLVTVKVGGHPCYRRNGNDLELNVPITLLEAVSGATVDVPTPKGTIALKIPPRTNSGKRLRVRGLGIETSDGKKGDLFAEVQIVLPEQIDDAALELIKQLEQGREADPRADLKW